MTNDGDRVAGELTELDAEECFRLVATLEVGRIAVTRTGGPPFVVPVNYVLDGEHIVFRSGEGSKLRALLEGPASFQVDFFDPFHRTGWSVLIQGAVEELDVAGLDHLSLTPWASGTKHHWLRVAPTVVTGRHLHMPPFVSDDRGYL